LESLVQSFLNDYQGVFFRKHTFEKAQSLNLVGWVMNAKDGSVVGAAQGEKKALSEL